MKTCWQSLFLFLVGWVVLMGGTAGSAVWGAEEDATPKTRTFTGRWNNKKYGTSGPLKCVATETAPGQWKATFTGTFHNDPFTYEANFQSKTVRNQQTVGGTAKVRGHDYQWTGTIKNGQLSANYKSSVGYFGQFVMKEVQE